MLRNCLRYLGLYLLIMSIASLMAALVAFTYNERGADNLFIVMTLLLIIIGTFLRQIRAAAPSQQMATPLLTLNFLLLIPLTSLPYIFIEKASIIDALFEGTSGLTTCGMTVFLDVEAFHKSVLLWRSMTEWLGGMALITIFLSLLKRTDSKIFAKTKGFDRVEDVEPTTLTKQMFLIYTTITVIGFLALLFLGRLDPFDALNHALTAISTGGFSTKNLGVLYFDQSTVFNPIAIELTLTTMSIAGMTSFVLLTGLLFRERKKKAFILTYRSDLKEVKVMFLGILIGTSILLWLFVTNLGLPIFTAIRKSFFHTITAMSGTGYNAMDLSHWTVGEKLVILIISIMGGSAWSAAGALKLIRVSSLLSFIQKIPNFIRKRGRVEIDNETKEALTYIAIFMVILTIGMLSLYPFLSNYSFLDVLYQVEGALGNTGPQILNVSQINFLGKFIFIILMVFGYLEILPIINLLKLIVAAVKSNIRKARFIDKQDI